MVQIISEPIHYPHLNLGEKTYREQPYRRQALQFLTPEEKSPKPLRQTVEKSPTTFFQTMEKAPC